jgi:hypothetical protein
MTRFQYINENFLTIKKEVKMGFIPPTVLSHFAIYSRYDYYRKLDNYVGFSVLFAADNCRVSESLVYKIIKEMEENV